MGGWPAGWVAGSIETKAISALKLELKQELAGAELGNTPSNLRIITYNKILGMIFTCILSIQPTRALLYLLIQQ